MIATTTKRANKKMTNKLFSTLLIMAAALLSSSTTTTMTVHAFSSSSSTATQIRKQSHSGFLGARTRFIAPSRGSGRSSSAVDRQGKSSMKMFLGNDGGILGVGTPEVAVILLVGYFVLGPSDLYKLVKEIGKFIQNVRTLGTEATKSFESSMENQLEITELRKAQSELNEAFSFRRSINTDTNADAFVEAFSEEAAATTAAAAATAAAGSTVLATEEGEGEEGAAPKKKKRRLVRRKKKKAVEEEIEEQPKLDEDMMMEYPDLDMLDTDLPEASSDEERLRAERLERLSGSSTSANESEPDWFKASDEDIASQILNNNNNEPSPAVQNAALDKFETNRFQSQLSAQDWNSQVMANEDKLAPLSMVMQRLAILEEEKQAADRRLEEEYQRRMDNEDKFYLEKRRVLEDAIGDIQDGVYGNLVDGEKKETMGEKETESATKFSA